MCILSGWLLYSLASTDLPNEHNMVLLIDFNCISEVVPSALFDLFISVVVLLALPVKTNLRIVPSCLVQTHANKSFTFPANFWSCLLAPRWSKGSTVLFVGFFWYIWRGFDMFGLFVLTSSLFFLFFF